MAKQNPPRTPAESKESNPSGKVEFPRHVNCPRCRADDTRATSTQGLIQYRECTRSICRERFKVTGNTVVMAKEPAEK